MKALLVVLGVAVVGVLVAVLLFLRVPPGGGPDEMGAASGVTTAASASPSASAASPAARTSVLLDAEGAVIEEFSGDCAGSAHRDLCRYVRRHLLAEDPAALTRTGLTIRTTIDPRFQQAAQRAIDAYVHRDDPQLAVMAMVVPGEGTVRALVEAGGGGVAETASGEEGAAGERGFQQGTTAMPYTLAAALAAGLRYDDGLRVSDDYRARTYQSFRNCKDQNVGDPYHYAHNRKAVGDRFATLRWGTEQAVNTFFLQLQEKIGLCETVTMAERLGLRRTDGRPLLEVETFTLGVNETDPVSVANSYATFAARGRFCEPRVIAEIRDAAGTTRSFPPRCEQVLDPEVADAVTGVLSGVLAGGPLKGIGREAAGMPGSSDGFMTAGYAGYTPGLAAAVDLGDPRGAYLHPLRDVTIGGRRYPQVDGMSIPGPAWKKAMSEALRGTPESGFTRPDAGRFGGCREACPG
ncbi:hypothetical protein Sme01_34370 [Sphaerisporangium melleum]|uniref:Penicillin-binding protein n=1 Tax=Sphaerisporangium melleum TaxID=321316 RepID=A0A917VGE1_9ACTN|nr:hypothetical protein [Sphaerisporangium melleum]GGK74779.1 hypothetical protein GCM10007964_17050 [Sphaerisporangium melleum]GII70961.1 hypothetical protein Sme01_34370 [Sphaerisporangium melleum]